MKPGILFLFLLSFLTLVQVTGQKKGQKMIVSGVVTDSDHTPVTGAAILVDGKHTSIITDNKGIFRIRVRPDARMIGAFSEHLGSSEIPVEGQATILLVLDGTFNLNQYIPEDEKTINMGYSSVKEKNLSVAPGKLVMTEGHYSSYSNIYDLIRGQIPGVKVTGKNIEIRGITSVNMSNQPLFVVDGVPVSSIDEIHPRFVKSITVLKGPEAAIYGARGATGVILIDLIGTEQQ